MDSVIKIGISSCLIGNAVRWNAGHKLDLFLTNTLGQFVDDVPVCPEVEAGFGVPRESMRLVGDPENPRLITFKTKIDHTDRMRRWVQKRVKELEKEDPHGFIFKSDSPSSGMIRVSRPHKGISRRGLAADQQNRGPDRLVFRKFTLETQRHPGSCRRGCGSEKGPPAPV